MSNYLIHSTGPWKKHKYIKKIGKKYFYKDGETSGSIRGGKDDHEFKNASGRATYGEYTEGDTDFDDANYDEKNRLGDTDFFGFQRSDGTWVVLEEDMKWSLPKGVDPTDPAFVKQLEDSEKVVEEKRNRGEQYTNKDWVDNTTNHMNKAIRNASNQRRVNEILKSDNSKNSVSHRNISHNYLIHSTGPWKKHKYIKKVGDKYYYAPEYAAMQRLNGAEKVKKRADRERAWNKKEIERAERNNEPEAVINALKLKAQEETFMGKPVTDLKLDAAKEDYEKAKKANPIMHKVVDGMNYVNKLIKKAPKINISIE